MRAWRTTKMRRMRFQKKWKSQRKSMVLFLTSQTARIALSISMILSTTKLAKHRRKTSMMKRKKKRRTRKRTYLHRKGQNHDDKQAGSKSWVHTDRIGM